MGEAEQFVNDGKNWSWEETLIAFELYTRIPYSKISGKNEEIMRIASLLGRKPGAVAKKLCNIAAHDPKQIDRGVSGLGHSSKFDSQIWYYFETDSSALSVDAKKALAKLEHKPIEKLMDYETDIFAVEMLPVGEERETEIRARIGQYFFRNAVLTAYDRKCCITGINEPKLLIASHIKPWRVSSPVNERTNPRNGLCLNSLHDRAFDQGLITLSTKYEIIISSKLKKMGMDEETQTWLRHYEGRKIELPNRFLPEKEFVEYHNDEIFIP